VRLIRLMGNVASSMRAGRLPRVRRFAGLMEKLATGAGDFAEFAVWLFSAERLALDSALVEARLQGPYPEGNWREIRWHGKRGGADDY